MSDGNMTYEDWLRGCVHHDGRHGYVTLPCDEVLKIADFIERLRADRKTENSSEKPNNCKTHTEGVWNAGFKTGYDKGYKDAQKVKDSQDLVKDLVKEFCEDGTWLERQGVYTLTLAEAKQRAADIIESVTQTETQNSNLTFEKDECAKEYEELGLKELKELINADRKTEPSLVKDSPSLVKDLVEDELYDEECLKCRHLKPRCEFIPTYCNFEPKQTEPQTRTDEDGRVWEYRNGNWWQLGKTESNSEKPNDCDTCANGESDIEACGYCRHGDLYEPKGEPQTDFWHSVTKEDWLKAHGL